MSCECSGPGFCKRWGRYVRQTAIDRCRAGAPYKPVSVPDKPAEPAGEYIISKSFVDTSYTRPLKYGVVLGSYGYPRLIELQIVLIKHHCGNVPIRVIDDCSDGYGPTPVPGSKFATLVEICNRHEVTLRTSGPERLGHSGGDLAVFWHGIQWAYDHGLDVVAKFSQRFLLDMPLWLQNGTLELLETGLPIASQACTDHGWRFDLRTEACLLDVTQWHRADILNHLFPRRVEAVAEAVLWHDVRDRLGGRFHPWSILPIDRSQKTPGIYWHSSETVTEYHQLARRHNLNLDEDFTVAGWQWKPGYVFG